MTSRDPKGAVGSTVGYPSDSLASCTMIVFILWFQRRLGKDTQEGAWSTFRYTTPSCSVTSCVAADNDNWWCQTMWQLQPSLLISTRHSGYLPSINRSVADNKLHQMAE